MSTPTEQEITEAFREIIDGRTVKRSRHDLTLNGKDHTTLFLKELELAGFRPMRVGEAEIHPGQRLPAFLVLDGTAWFGWVFWEKFSQLRLRKLFGTVVRNSHGDWLHQLPAHSTSLIYTDPSRLLEMDIDRPFEL